MKKVFQKVYHCLAASMMALVFALSLVPQEAFANTTATDLILSDVAEHEGKSVERPLQITPEVRQQILSDLNDKGANYSFKQAKAACTHKMTGWTLLNTIIDKSGVNFKKCVVVEKDYYRICSKNCGHMEGKTVKSQLAHKFPSGGGKCKNGCGLATVAV